MLDDSPDLAAHRVAFAPAQTFDLLGDVLAVETVVGDRHRAQHHRLMLGPGVKVVVVASSIRHGRHRLEVPPTTSADMRQSASFAASSCCNGPRAAPRGISPIGADNITWNLPRTTK